MRKNNPLENYEANIETLENLISALENGGLSLDEAMKNYEQGIKLIRSCQKALATAEQKITQLSADSDEASAGRPAEGTVFEAEGTGDDDIPF